MAGGAAERAGLRQGDVVLRMGEQVIVDGQQLRELIRASVANGEALAADLAHPARMGRHWRCRSRPEVEQEGELRDRPHRRLSSGAPPELVTVRYGPLDGLWQGAVRTWEVSVLTLRMMGRMLIGEASLKNLSGPLTIADYAGKIGQPGLDALPAVSGADQRQSGRAESAAAAGPRWGAPDVLSLGGVTGKSVSDVWMERLQRGGVAILLVMMSIALFNDVTRLLG